MADFKLPPAHISYNKWDPPTTVVVRGTIGTRRGTINVPIRRLSVRKQAAFGDMVGSTVVPFDIDNDTYTMLSSVEACNGDHRTSQRALTDPHISLVRYGGIVIGRQDIPDVTHGRYLRVT